MYGQPEIVSANHNTTTKKENNDYNFPQKSNEFYHEFKITGRESWS
jgi:hypothetical protein